MDSAAFEKTIWSYSRLTAFEDCPYRFYIMYILGIKENVRQFYSGFGLLMHGLLADFYSGRLEREQLVPQFLLRYRQDVPPAPSDAVFDSYFHQGMECLKRADLKREKELGVEKHVLFQVGSYPFQGYIDRLCEIDGALHIVDHKSHKLKPYSGKLNKTSADRELDRYLRQLYLYAIPVKKLCGRYPDYLTFNCFRSGRIVSVPFDPCQLARVEDWAVDTIEYIKRCDAWPPSLDYFKCNFICGFNDACEYFEL